jgi:HD domain
MPRARVGSLEWERQGGPPLALDQRAALLGGSALVVLRLLGARVRWRLGQRGLLPARVPPKVDLSAWAPPDSSAARTAERHLREVSSPELVHHSFRSYYFSAIAYELSGLHEPIDREALYVAVLLHDVGLFEPALAPSEHCFTIASARAARSVAREAGWSEARANAMAVAITANLNPFVSATREGLEAAMFSLGGTTEVFAQEWRLHPDNLREVLARHPRDGFAKETAKLVRREGARHPGCRFACFGPLFSAAIAYSVFDAERIS